MRIRKWDEKKHEYNFVDVPDDWDLTLLTNDMDHPINCVNCGRVIPFGEGYTSKRYHTFGGMGFYECHKCYEEYWDVYMASKLTEFPHLLEKQGSEQEANND